MVGQVAGIYFRTYQLAHDVAKRVERAFRYELGIDASNYIRFGYWDSLKKGLLAGEHLFHDLKRMEVAYLEQNKREYELTKHISLLLHNPMALIMLKASGQCEVELPEALFDADYPGHYMRRLKSVSLTIPCVVGPYTSINCMLTLLSSKTRIDNKATNEKTYAAQEESQVISKFGAIQSIATSHAQNDSGLFELSFCDERYLPFEGAGAVSRWRIDLPKDSNAFDFNTLSDVVLHLKYTAREGGNILKAAAKNAMQAVIADVNNAPLARLFSARHEFPPEWHRFLHPKDTDDKQTLQLDLKPERFPFQFRGKTITIKQVEMFLKLKDGVKLGNSKTYTETYADAEYKPLIVSLKPPVGAASSKPLESLPSFFNGIPHTVMDVLSEIKEASIWVLEAKSDDIGGLSVNLRNTITVEEEKYHHLKPDAIEDMVIVCRYSVA